MLTIKHVEKCGVEGVFEAESANYFPRDPERPKAQCTAFGVPGSGYLTFDDGKVFVMNDKGRTIANYDLDADNAEERATTSRDGMSIAQIKHMVDRFLSWRLPENFNPDGGISYTRPNYAPNVEATPSGTNLFDVTQAEAMVRHMIEGLPSI
jgi:hypothetical protein